MDVREQEGRLLELAAREAELVRSWRRLPDAVQPAALELLRALPTGARGEVERAVAELLASVFGGA